MKTCIICKVPKPIEDFYVHPQMSDGRLGKCKQCCKDYEKQRRKDPEVSEKMRAYKKEQAQLPQYIEMRKNYAQSHSEVCEAIRKRWEERNPDKLKVKNAVNNAVRDGKIVKKPCEVCGNEKVEGHHEDYTKPLEVQWLCKKHHWAADQLRRQREALTTNQKL